MLPTEPTSNGIRAASFIRRSGNFSDLSNELKRLARIAAFLFITFYYSFGGNSIGLTVYEMLFPLKPKNPV